MRPFGLGLLLAGAMAGLTTPVAGQASNAPAGPVEAQVAQRVRAALSAPADEEAWRGLAQALPELAVAEQTDVITVFEASRLADSLARTPLEASLVGTESEVDPPAMETGVGASERAPSRDGSSVPLYILPWLAVAALAGIVRWTRRPRNPAAGPASPRVGPRRLKAPKDQRLWTVTTLASSGLPAVEIARRTGMSREAVQVLLGLRSGGAPQSGGSLGGGAALPPFQTVPSSIGDPSAGVTAARRRLAEDAGRLRDGLLTYGRGRVA